MLERDVVAVGGEQVVQVERGDRPAGERPVLAARRQVGEVPRVVGRDLVEVDVEPGGGRPRRCRRRRAGRAAASSRSRRRPDRAAVPAAPGRARSASVEVTAAMARALLIAFPRCARSALRAGAVTLIRSQARSSPVRSTPFEVRRVIDPRRATARGGGRRGRQRGPQDLDPIDVDVHLGRSGRRRILMGARVRGTDRAVVADLMGGSAAHRTRPDHRDAARWRVRARRSAPVRPPGPWRGDLDAFAGPDDARVDQGRHHVFPNQVVRRGYGRWRRGSADGREPGRRRRVRARADGGGGGDERRRWLRW